MPAWEPWVQPLGRVLPWEREPWVQPLGLRVLLRVQRGLRSVPVRRLRASGAGHRQTK